VIVKAGNPLNIHTLDDFCGKRIALNTGTVQAKIAQDQSTKCTDAGKAEVQITTYNGGPALFLAVKQGRADITMNDVVLAAQIVNDNPDLANAFNLVTADTVGYAVKKGNTDLLNAVFEAVKILQENGTQQKIETTYGIDPTLMIPVEIRLAK
jgi:polar amino acid transport system substrate-binding protein